MKYIFIQWFKFPEALRFLLVGGWNTLISILLFGMVLKLMQDYKISLFISHIISVFHSFVNLRIFVFQSKGHFWKEYFKVNCVYTVYFLLNFVMLFASVELLKLHAFFSQSVITCILVIISYLANKHFTFKNA